MIVITQNNKLISFTRSWVSSILKVELIRYMIGVNARLRPIVNGNCSDRGYLSLSRNTLINVKPGNKIVANNLVFNMKNILHFEGPIINLDTKQDDVFI